LVVPPLATNTRYCERSIAIYTACLALTQKCEIVVFSPARRASRKLLERMIEFVRLLGHEPIGGLASVFERTVLPPLFSCSDAPARRPEYNQEQARIRAYDGSQSLIRSFPSKVGVRRALNYQPGSRDPHTHTHTREKDAAAAAQRRAA
tara:strand:- start:8026 stop:8472 length:447 start_codon:yes stop_codon:yes gene_type:complete